MTTELKLLVLEDEPNDAKLEIAELESNGYHCEWTRIETREEFISCLESNEYDLIISDYALPSFDGLSALAIVMEKKIGTPFILVSGTLGEDAAIECLTAGATDYVLKTRLTRLCPVVKRALNEQQKRSEYLQNEVERKRLMIAIEQAAEIILITDATGTIEYVSSAVESSTGYRSEELIGKNPKVFSSGKQDKHFYKNLWDTLLSGTTWTGQFINKKKNGDNYYEDATISPVRNEFGEITSYVAVKRDVTEKVQLERELQQTQKMESIGHLVGGVAHDFNNLLQAINGYAEMVANMLTPEHPAYADVLQISNAGNLAKELIGQLMAFSRKQPINPTPLNLNQEVGSLQKILRRVINENIEFNFILDDTIGAVCLDKGQLQQILMNLCVNARDAMTEGGELTIQTERVTYTVQEASRKMLEHAGEYVAMRVMDTGCGMSEEVCDRGFEPFFTTKEQGKGTGLGLSTVYGIVKQNHGHIHVSSAIGKGTVITISFPVKTPYSAKENSADADDSTLCQGEGETILVVEDNELILDFMTKLLQNAGYKILSAKDGLEALQVFEKYSGEIKLVIMDVIMPRMCGQETALKMLEIDPEIIFIFTSGYISSQDFTDYIRDSGYTLLRKPYNSTCLLQSVRKELDDWKRA